MKKRIIPIVALALFVTLFFTACMPNSQKTDTDTATEQKAESKGTIAVLNYAFSGPYFQRGEQFAKDVGKKYGYDVIYTGTPEVDTAKLISLIQDMTQKGVKAICIASGDASSVVPALKEARAKGIKVVSWDLDIDKEGRDAYAGLMDLAVGLGEPILDTVVKTIGEEGEWAILDGVMTNAFLAKRAQAIKDIAAKKYPKLKLVAHESMDEDPNKAYTVTQNLITAYPNLKAIVSNVSTAYGPAGKAIADSGKVGKVFICGQSSPNLAKDAIASGAGKFATLWDPGRWAEFVTTVAVKLVEGESMPDGKLNWTEFPKATRQGDIFYYYEAYDFDKDNIAKFNF